MTDTNGADAFAGWRERQMRDPSFVKAYENAAEEIRKVKGEHARIAIEVDDAELYALSYILTDWAGDGSFDTVDGWQTEDEQAYKMACKLYGKLKGAFNHAKREKTDG